MRCAFALLVLVVARTPESDALQLPQALAGQAAGVSHDALIVAGGSSFNLPPWKGGAKQWSADIYVFTPSSNRPLTFALPHALAYGCSAVWHDRLIIAGGSDGIRNYSQVYSLEWNNGTVHIAQLAALPTTLSHCAATIAGDSLYVFGGQTSIDSSEASAALYRLPLNKADRNWQTCARLPALGRIMPVVASVNKNVYLFSGAALTPERKYLNDSWEYNEQDGWQRMPHVPEPVVAAPVFVHRGKILIFGGDNGQLASKVAALQEKHPGFSKTIREFDTSTKTWTIAGTLSSGLVTSAACWWNGAVHLPGGEDRPGHRSAEFVRWQLKQ